MTMARQLEVFPLPPLPTPDYTRLQEYILIGHNDLLEYGSEPKDFEHFVYERAMEAIFGRGYWEWYNDNVEEGRLLDD